MASPPLTSFASSTPAWCHYPRPLASSGCLGSLPTSACSSWANRSLAKRWWYPPPPAPSARWSVSWRRCAIAAWSGLAGSAEKCAYIVDELGFDVAINYRAEEVGTALAAACPDGIDIYFDNVGGVILDTVLQHLNFKARVPMCGAVSEYNGELQARPGPSWNRLVQTSEAILTGFRQSQWADRHEEAFAMLAMWVRTGKLKYREDVVVGLENAAGAFIGLLQGKNFGKLLVQVGEDPTRAA